LAKFFYGQKSKKSLLIKKVGESGGKWEKVCTFDPIK
jgi:hypothetical protein